MISSGKLGSTLTNLTGTLNSRPNTTYRIEFFSSPSVDSSGFGEGKTYLGFVNVTTNGSGNASFSPWVALTAAGAYISATATSPTGDTSEFGRAYKLPTTTTASSMSTMSVAPTSASLLSAPSSGSMYSSEEKELLDRASSELLA